MNLTKCISTLTLIGLILVIKNARSAFIDMPSTEFNYAEALEKSLLFYEAQRSGKLPPDNRIPWRGDSALNDKGKRGEDLTGGYYDSGDYVKFIGLQAATASILAWGLLEGSQGYKKVDLMPRGLESLKWATDFLIKCHVAPNKLYVQVGDLQKDLAYWGRPEDMKMHRRAFKIDDKHPASDIAGETAAALAAASIVFRQNNDLKYSEICLKHAVRLYDFATKHVGQFCDNFETKSFYYNSTSYIDELAWAAVWLFRATNNETYLNDSLLYENKFNSSEIPYYFTMGERLFGVKLLLAQITGDDNYKSEMISFCDYQANEQNRTAHGLIFIERHGVLGLAANVAFLCMQVSYLDKNQDRHRDFAKDQIDYMLGKYGQSFVVGFGENYPLQPHHRASSCTRTRCLALNDKEINPHTLYGALVSGPDFNDGFVDMRDGYVYTDVNIEWNAGFQSALAMIIDFTLPENRRRGPEIEIIPNVKIEERFDNGLVKIQSKR